MRTFLTFLLLLIISLTTNYRVLSNSQVDSLKKQLLFCTDSIQRADLLHEIARNISLNKETNNQTTIYLEELLQLSTRINYVEGLVKYYDLAGHFDRNNSDYASALQKHFKALQLAEENKLIEYLPRIYNNIGVVYRRIDDFTNAINFHLKSLKVAEMVNDKSSISYAYNSIGNIYSLSKQYDKALEFFQKSLEFGQQNKNKRSIAINLNNIGEVYEFMEQYEKALEFYSKSLSYNLEINSIKGLGISYDCIGNIYRKSGKYEKALSYYLQGVEMHKKHGEELFMAISLKNIGIIYLELDSMKFAEKNIDQSMKLALSIASKSTIAELYKIKVQISERRNDPVKALYYERLRTQYNDSVWNENNSINIAKLQAIYNSERQLEAILKLNRENELNEKIIERQNRLNFTLIIIISLVLIFSLLLYREYQIKKKNNNQLKAQANVISRKNKALVHQKKRIQLIHTRITDSLNYAQRIQRALLPSNEMLSSIFKDYFVLYMPLEVVSGDFYWVSKQKNQTLIVAADCTGHGVPGAMMSMLGISYLNELVLRSDVKTPADYLNELRNLVILSLKQNGSFREIKDGISLSFCICDSENKTLQFAGAQSSVVTTYYDDTKNEYSIVEHKGENMPIGYFRELNHLKII
ncbi:MAG: tetratricopeptide repeat protein [Salinivirgaceae bacterium]|nr:tetratricopeptide repeat protein [Salinivirgaceae bacterium]